MEGVNLAGNTLKETGRVLKRLKKFEKLGENFQ